MATISKISSLLFSSSKPKLIHHILSPSSNLRTLTTASSRITKTKKTEAALAKEKRRTRSDKELDQETIIELYNNNSHLHVPVMLSQVLDVFSNCSLTSFVDCTLGAAGHSTNVIRGHPELKYFVGMDVDPVGRDTAQSRISSVLDDRESSVKVFTVLRNFRHIKSVLRGTGEEHLGAASIDGILMDLGMSSMQVDDPQRGFSVLGDGPLDMRMDPQAYDRQALKQKTY